MPTVAMKRGLTVAEYEAARTLFKSRLPFPVNMRRHTEKYVLGAVSIIPTKAQKGAFTVDQVESIRALLIAEGYVTEGLADYNAYAFKQGFWYMMLRA